MQAPSVFEGREASTDLLRSVAEQLKVPLTLIARQAELAALLNNFESKDAANMHAQASVALTLVDSYLLGLQLLSEQGELALEPVSVSSTLTDVAHELYRIAQQHDVILELAVAGKYAPVMAHPHGLRAAMLSLGYGFVEARAAHRVTESVTTRRHRLTLAVHRTPHGIVAGAYGMFQDFGAAQWRTALKLYGRAVQPCLALGPGSGAGLFVADTIFRSMATRLRVGRHQKETGLAVTLQPSRQLTIV